MTVRSSKASADKQRPSVRRAAVTGGGEAGAAGNGSRDHVAAAGQCVTTRSVSESPTGNRRTGLDGDLTGHPPEEEVQQERGAVLERQMAERTLELRRSEARCSQLAEASFEGIVISEGGVVVDCNSQFLKLFGYDQAGIAGRRLADFFAPESRSWIEERVGSDDASANEFLCVRKDGTTFPAEIRVRIQQEAGHSVRITALRDLTEVKAAAAKIQAQRAELEATRRLALVSEISAGIIHQITQPLSSIGINLMLVVAELQACRCRSCQGLGILAEIQADVGRMRDIVTHLKKLDDPAGLTRVLMDPNAVIAGVMPLLQPSAEGLEIAVGVVLEENLPLVAMDWVQMGQVALNLVRNAFDACAGCEPERRVVTIRTRSLGAEGVELSVCDAGDGIAPAVAERLFSPLFSTKPTGLGIGLRLSRTIVEAHGGTITGENNPDGCGATFRVVLPVATPQRNYTKG